MIMGYTRKVLDAAIVMRKHLANADIATRAELQSQIDRKYSAEGTARDALTSDEIDGAIKFLLENGYIASTDNKSEYQFVA
jgi:hypothetical protein